MDSDGTNVRQIYGSDKNIAGALVSPDKTKIVFYEQEGFVIEAAETTEIFLINSDGTNLMKLTTTSLNLVLLRFSSFSL